MIRIKKQTPDLGTVIRNILQLNEYQSSILDEYVPCLLYTEEFDQGLHSFGGLSQVEFQLSQDRSNMNESLNFNLVSYNKFYREPFLVFEEIVSSCRNEVQIKEMMGLMRIQHMKHILSKVINAKIGHITGTVLFGENNSSNRSGQMHKFLHERFGK